MESCHLQVGLATSLVDRPRSLTARGKRKIDHTSGKHSGVMSKKKWSQAGKFRGVCDMFGLPGTTFWKLPVPRKPV